MARFCTACGTPLGDETGRFCAKCGAAVAAPPTSHIAVTPKGETTSYKKVFFSTYAVIAAVLCLIAVLWIAGELRSSYATRAAEKHEREAKQQVVNLKNCMDLSGPVIGPEENDLRMKLAYAAGVGNHGDTAGIDDLTQKVRADNDWLEHHTLMNVWNDGRGDYYDGMTDENYAACQARFNPEIKQAQAQAGEAAAKKTEQARMTEARHAEVARLSGIDYFQRAQIKVYCNIDDKDTCDDSEILRVIEPLDSKFRPSKKQLACVLAEAKFQYNLFHGGLLVQTINRDPSNEVTGRGTKTLYDVITNPWPQDFTAPTGCQ
jgi:hypothetical protein